MPALGSLLSPSGHPRETGLSQVEAAGARELGDGRTRDTWAVGKVAQMSLHGKRRPQTGREAAKGKPQTEGEVTRPAGPAGGLRGRPPAPRVPAHHWAPVLPRTMPGLSQRHCGIMVRTQYIINGHTAWGLPSTACETTGLFSRPTGRRLRTPRAPVPAARSAWDRQSGLTAPRPARVAP